MERRLYSFKVLPFGLVSAPRIFTNIMKPVFAAFRANIIKCCYYIDDSLVINKNYDECRCESQLTVNESDKLGFTINWKKSVLEPSQRIVFFGLIIDLVQFKVFLTEEKVQKIVSLCNEILKEKYVAIRLFASLIGLVVHAFNAIFEGPMHYKNMERDKIQKLRELNDYDSKMLISNESEVEAIWWLNNVGKLNGKYIQTPSIDSWIETDASLEGWGARFSSNFVGGRWTLAEYEMDIYELELLAIKYSLKAFFHDYKQCHIGIKSDNTSAVSYINAMGGMT
jgi:hypothetical protein